MSLTQSATFSLVEKYLGEAYARMTDAVGTLEDPSTALYQVSKVKNLIRGGYQCGYGLIPNNPLDTSDRSGMATGSSGGALTVYCPTTTVIINNVVHTLKDSTIALGALDIEGRSILGVFTAANNVPSTHWRYNSVIAAQDLTRLGVADATYVVRKQHMYDGQGKFTEALLGPIAKRQAAPSYFPRYEVPISLAYCTPTFAFCATTPREWRGLVYAEPPSDDDIVEDLFPAANAAEDALESMTLASEFRSLLDAIKNNCRSVTGQEFTTYWKGQGYNASEKFRKLYSDVYLADMSVQAGYAAGAGSPSYVTSYTNYKLYRPANFESILLYTIPSGEATAQLDCWLETNKVVKNTGWLWANDATLMTESLASWPTAGYIRVWDPGYCTGYITTYNRGLSPTIVAIGSGYVATAPIWSDIRLLEKVTQVFSDSPSGYASLISGDFIGLALATVSGNATAAFLIRSY